MKNGVRNWGSHVLRRHMTITVASHRARRKKRNSSKIRSETLMKATIYHNPKCGTSRKTLDILNEAGVDVTVVQYLKTPPSRDELQRLYARAGMTPRDGLRAKEPLASELGLNAAETSDEKVLDAMIDHPILINRPLVETDKGVKLCRPQDLVRTIL